MNKPAASSEAHVAVARRPGDVPVLPWTKNHRIPPMKSGNNDRSTTSGPTSLLQSTHLAPAPSAAAENDGRQRHIEKQISPSRRPRCRSERSTGTRCHQLRDTAVKVVADMGVELRQIYLPEHRSHHHNDAPKQTSADAKLTCSKQSLCVVNDQPVGNPKRKV
jgi:hypothetical protein